MPGVCNGGREQQCPPAASGASADVPTSVWEDEPFTRHTPGSQQILAAEDP